MTKVVQSTLAMAALSTFALLPACGGPDTPDTLEVIDQSVVNGTRLPSSSYRSAIVYATPDFVSGSSGWLCSGTVVGPRHILTAAHCVGKLDFITVDEGEDAYEKAVYRPDVADEMKRGRKLKVTDARNSSVKIQQKPWVDVTIKGATLSPPWVKFARQTENPGYGELLDAGRADLAIIETQENITSVLGNIRPALVDTRPVASDAAVTMVGFGCEKWTIDAEGNVEDNWGTRVTGEYGRTTAISARQAAEIDWAKEADYYSELGFTFEDVLGYFETVAKGYLLSAGPGIPPARKGSPRVGICPGDSGGGVYRGTNDTHVVGVNSGFYYSFSDPGPASLSVYGRMDGEGGVAWWLRKNLPNVL